MSILEGELAQIITDALLDANVPFDIVVQRVEYAEAANPWEQGEKTITDYQCKGFTEEYDISLIAGGFVQTNDMKVIVLAPTLSIMPVPMDTVFVHGKPYIIISAKPDPAFATIALQARG